MSNNARQFNKNLLAMIKDLEGERKTAISIFESKIISFLSAESGEFKDVLDDYNNVLILLISNIQDLHDELASAFLNSNEKITYKTFVLSGEKRRPIIKYWIKDFIAAQGSGIFSNIDLSKYITTSENVKLLDDKEKRLVKKLLRLYRNLIFFPDSLKDLPPDRWEIFPLDREGGDFEKLRHQPLSPPKSEDEKELAKLEEMEKDYAPNSLEKLALDEEIANRKKIEELRFMVSKYKEDSLERRVLEEEILKLES